MRVNQTSNGKSSRYWSMCRNTFTKASWTDLVGIGGVAQILERDPHGPPLEQRHEGAEPIPRGVPVSRGDQSLDFRRQRGSGRRMGSVGATGCGATARSAKGCPDMCYGMGRSAVYLV